MTDFKTIKLKDVEILAAGTWRGSYAGKPVSRTYTDKDIQAIVDSFDEITANKELNYEPPAKLGHDKGQKLLQADGYPAAGFVEKLKKVGEKLLADFRDVPAKVGKLIEARGYKVPSAEIFQDYEIGGKTYPLVLKAVAFLGGDIPAVKSIGDMVAQYGEDGVKVEGVFYEAGEVVALSEADKEVAVMLGLSEEAMAAARIEESSRS